MEQEHLTRNNQSDTGSWVDEQLAALEPEDNWEPDIQRGPSLLDERRSEKRRVGRRWVWAGAMVAATFLLAMATPLTRAFAQRCLSACVSETSRVGQLLNLRVSGPITSGALIEPQNRKPAPDFTLNDSTGAPVTLSAFRGQVMLLNFWATWCAPCRVEIPMLMELQRAHRDGRFAVLGVALDDAGWKAVKPYVQERKIDYPVLVADDRIADLFGGLQAVPTTLMIDKQGRVASTHLGLLQKSECENIVNLLLNER
ncbi:MAG TPA: TlpA disulfide reductase family protein [Bryobacteraceae bacterium]